LAVLAVGCVGCWLAGWPIGLSISAFLH